MARYERIIAALFDEPWAIMPSKLEALTDFARTKIHVGISDAEIAAIAAEAQAKSDAMDVSGVKAGVAVIPIFGTMSPRLNMMSAMSGGTSTMMITKQIRAAAADSTVTAIVPHFHTPGGSVYGVPELAAEILNARKAKPVIAQVDMLAASAGYWAAASADEVVITPSGELGSIGVYMAHVDVSQLLENNGEKITYISAGKYKVEGNPTEPLSEDAEEYLQSRVDEYYRMFTGAVAAGRQVSRSDVEGGFGQGRVVGADQAVKLNMADRVGTIEDTLSRLSTPRRMSRVKRRATRRLALASGLARNMA